MTAKQTRDTIMRELRGRPKLLRELAVSMSASGPEIRVQLVNLKKSGRVKPCFYLGDTNPYWLRTTPLIGSDATPCHFCHQPCGDVQYVHSDPPGEQYATCGDCMRGLGQLALMHVEGGKPVLSVEGRVREAYKTTSPSPLCQ